MDLVMTESITQTAKSRVKKGKTDTKTLRIRLNRAHKMELLSGCPEAGCHHFRSRWSDVEKHSPATIAWIKTPSKDLMGVPED